MPPSPLASERHIIKSNATGVTYEISIALPYAYAPEALSGGPFSKPLTIWPVVYLTDANWHMGMVTGMVREMAWCGRTTDAIIVGLGYPESESPQETWRSIYALRSQDLTPVRIESEELSGTAWLKRQVK